MSDSHPQTLLVCENEGCDQQYVDEVDEKLEGDAASLPLAIKAHKAGWQLVDGKIFCPRCSQGKKHPN